MAPAEIHQRTSAQVEPRLLDRVRETIRRKHYSLRTEVAYIDWIKRYIFFHRKRHPAKWAPPKWSSFLITWRWIGESHRLLKIKP
jgi:hypothetical protein